MEEEEEVKEEGEGNTKWDSKTHEIRVGPAPSPTFRTLGPFTVAGYTVGI